MNKQQQELYEKLLKKVNEYCLGYAAEDVIAAIDDLVDTYEKKITIFFGSRANGKTTMLLNTYEEHKALEIIYTKEVDINWLTLQFEGADIKDVIEYVENYPTMCSDKPLTADEVTLLKEIYDDILQVQKC